MAERFFHTCWSYMHLMAGAFMTCLCFLILRDLRKAAIVAAVLHVIYELSDVQAYYDMEPGISFKRWLYGTFYGIPPADVPDEDLKNSPWNSVGDIAYFTLGQALALALITHPQTKKYVGYQAAMWLVLICVFLYYDEDPITAEIRAITMGRLRAQGRRYFG